MIPFLPKLLPIFEAIGETIKNMTIGLIKLIIAIALE